MKRKQSFLKNPTPKTKQDVVRNFKFSQIEELKLSSVFSFIKKIQQNPMCKIDLMNLKRKCNPVLQEMFKYYNNITNEDYGTDDFNILMQKSTSPFLNAKNETINKMIEYSGLTNSLSTLEIHKYSMKRPPLISYKHHKYEFSEPLPGEYPCMHNDNNSSKSFCLAQKHHGITLKSMRIVKEIKFNPKTQTQEINFKSEKGICLYCERYLYNQIFYICRENNGEIPFTLNSNYRYLVDLEGEYKKEYMLSQQTPKFFGIIHYFPKFKRDMFIPAQFKKKFNGKEYVVRGLIEKDDCFTK